MKRRDLLALLGGSLVVLPDIAGAQPAKNTDRAQFCGTPQTPRKKDHTFRRCSMGPRDHGDVEGRALTLDNWLPNEEPHRSVGITTVDGLGTYAELRPCLYCAQDRPIVIAIPGDALPKSWGKCIETHHG